jgi:type IV pilus biogenesis protein CpaD/CtpE
LKLNGARLKARTDVSILRSDRRLLHSGQDRLWILLQSFMSVAARASSSDGGSSRDHPARAMANYVTQESLNGSPITWVEKVTGAEYLASVPAD